MAKRQRRGGGRGRRAAEPTARKSRFDEEGFYKKYPHVVPGSVKEVPAGTEVDGLYSHGRVCQIQCANCPAKRTINVQDAWQTKLCADDQKKSGTRAKPVVKRRTRTRKAS